MDPAPMTSPADVASTAQSEQRLGVMILENRTGAELLAGVEHFRKAAEIWNLAGWPTRRAEVLLDLARLYAKAHDHVQAALAAEESLRLFVGASDPQGGLAAIAAGNHRLAASEPASAAEHFRVGVRLADQAIEHLRAAEARLGLGRALIGVGNGGEAIQHLESALTTFTAFRQAALAATTLAAQADALLVNGDQVGAAAAIDASVASFQQLGRPIDAHEALTAHAELVLRIGDRERAGELWERALGWHRDSGNKAMQGRCLRRLGAIKGQAKDYPAAADHFRAAVEICRATNDLPGISRSLLLLGTAQQKAGDLAGALDSHSASLAAAESSGNLNHTEEALAAIATSQRRRGLLPEALASLKRRVDVLKQLGDRQEQLEVLGAMAEVLQEQGATSEAEGHLRRLIAVCLHPEDAALGRRARHQLGFMYSQLGRHGEAMELLIRALDGLAPDGHADRMQIHYRITQSALHLGDMVAATTNAASALTAYAASGLNDAKWHTRLLVASGNAKALRGEKEAAKADFEQAAIISEASGDLKQTITIRKATQRL